jgi:hypothetical protein
VPLTAEEKDANRQFAEHLTHDSLNKYAVDHLPRAFGVEQGWTRAALAFTRTPNMFAFTTVRDSENKDHNFHLISLKNEENPSRDCFPSDITKHQFIGLWDTAHGVAVAGMAIKRCVSSNNYLYGRVVQVRVRSEDGALYLLVALAPGRGHVVDELQEVDYHAFVNANDCDYVWDTTRPFDPLYTDEFRRMLVAYDQKRDPNFVSPPRRASHMPFSPRPDSGGSEQDSCNSPSATHLAATHRCASHFQVCKGKKCLWKKKKSCREA